ncbi:TetR/AcrR family transcriptional regulator [Spongiactinospora sp. 9N601]|uniref:TetR/AcrR family transcriptional regulator n=1 Tax=Spongiactinospora sp. 9N601 TaxID=3375149 RepID=UPI0037B96BCA
MARTVDPAAHASRREEYLQAAQHLVESRGYAQMSVQDVLAETGTSKGAFYHYFDSKQALLEALIERNADLLRAHLAPIAHEGELLALERLQNFFTALAGWKSQRRDLLIALLRIWYSDDNAVVRHKTRATVSARILPLLAAIVGQGMNEGVFAARDADGTARVLLSLVNEVNDALGELLLAAAPNAAPLSAIESVADAYTDALERVLGLAPGSLLLLDAAAVAAWLDDSAPASASNSTPVKE